MKTLSQDDLDQLHIEDAQQPRPDMGYILADEEHTEAPPMRNRGPVYRPVDPIEASASENEDGVFAALVCFILIIVSAGFGLGLFVGYCVWGAK